MHPPLSGDSLYMTITSHEYKNKGLGIGLMSIGQWL